MRTWKSPPGPRAAGPLLRAGQAQSALADRSVHLHAQAAEPTGLPGRVPGRPQPVHRRLRAARQPVDGAGARGVAGGDHRVRHARGSADRQRHAVRDLARQERLHQGVREARRQADRGVVRTGRRRWARSNASGARCGGSASRPRCSSTWAMPGPGSVCSSTITTSSVRIRESTARCRPIASSVRPRR